MNNTSESSLEARRSANKSYQQKWRVNKREAKKQEEEKALESLCSPPQYQHLYEGPESDKNEDERKQRHSRVKRNIKREEKILNEERDLESECRSKFPRLRLYDARPFGESNDEKRARRRKISRRMEAMKKYLSSGENLKQQQARRLKIRRGLDAAKAAKALDPGVARMKQAAWMQGPSPFGKTVAYTSMILCKTAWLLKLRIITSVLCRFAFRSGSGSKRTWASVTRLEQ